VLRGRSTDRHRRNHGMVNSIESEASMDFVIIEAAENYMRKPKSDGR
jgi:hypothetical protein